jgi:2-keto-3-deoxy-L-rhamnonate aldolase RhmA
MTVRTSFLVPAVCLIAYLTIVGPQAQGQAGGGRGAGRQAAPPQAGYTTPDGSKPQGWAVRDYLSNTVGWDLSKPLWNTAKQKLLDGKQIFSWTASTNDTDLYCQMAPHYDFIWIEMQHSTMSWADVEHLVGACPHAGATPMVRLPDEFESTIQKATDLGAIGMIEPTVDTVEKAEAVARFARYPPFGRRSLGGSRAPAIWGVNGVNYRQEVNANMLVVVMCETPTCAANIYDIARVPGVDLVLAANTDLGNFSGYAAGSPQYEELVTKIHDATLKAGKFLGATNASYATGGPGGRTDSADFRFFQNGPSKDGFQPPARGARGGPAGGGTPGRGAAPGGAGGT